MIWDEETIRLLRDLWTQGHSTAEIGRRLGCGKNAIVGKAHRLELDRRKSPFPPRSATKAPEERRSPRAPFSMLPTLRSLATPVHEPVTTPSGTDQEIVQMLMDGISNARIHTAVGGTIHRVRHIRSTIDMSSVTPKPRAPTVVRRKQKGGAPGTFPAVGSPSDHVDRGEALFGDLAACEMDPAMPLVEMMLRSTWAQPSAKILRFVNRNPGACCWPIGEPGAKDFRFCDDASPAGKPYCGEHAKLAYVPRRPGTERAA